MTVQSAEPVTAKPNRGRIENLETVRKIRALAVGGPPPRRSRARSRHRVREDSRS